MTRTLATRTEEENEEKKLTEICVRNEIAIPIVS